MMKFGLIGHPLAGSGSPALFAAAYGGRWQYNLIEGDDFEISWQRFIDEYQAINITAPFKEKAFAEILAHGVLGGGFPVGNGNDSSRAGNGEDEVKAIGAINIAVKESDGLVHGYNSDYLGVLKILRDKGFGPGRTALVAGFGGAGKAAAAAAKAAGLDTLICNRTRYNPAIRPLEELPVLAGVADILIYTLAFPVPELDFLLKAGTGKTGGAKEPAQAADGHGFPAAILEANYRTPCLAGLPGYIPGTQWLRAQAETGYPLMTGLPVQNSI